MKKEAIPNRYFDAENLAAILDPAQWTLLGTGFPDTPRVLRHRAHRDWMRQHTERHPAREILFALKGTGRYGFKDRIYACPPGTALFFDAYEPHDGFYPAFAGPWVHLWLRLFQRDLLGQLIDIDAGRVTYIHSSLVVTDHPAAELLWLAWNAMSADAECPAPFRRARLSAALAAALMRIVQEGYAAPDPGRTGGFQHRVIETIKRHVAEMAGRDVSLAEAARLAGYSKFHFLRLFKQETGMTFHDYVNECRRKTAAALLREGRTKTAVSQALGFSHPSSFLRWMKAQQIPRTARHPR